MNDEPQSVVIYLARLHAREGHGDAVAAALIDMTEAVAAGEPGCREYRAARSRDQPRSFIVYEEYIDHDALLAHRRTPHMRDIVEARMAPLLDAREGFELSPLAAPPRNTGTQP